MQDRYAGDIGDYVKLAMLRSLSAGKRLGILWWLYPDESHNQDGKHVSYLTEPGKWRSRGTRNPSVRALGRLAAALKIKPALLLEEA